MTALAATQLSISSFGDVTAGVTFSVTVDAVDPYGNTDMNFNGNITLSLAAIPRRYAGGNADRDGGDGEATFNA